MEYEITHQPSDAILTVTLAPGERIVAEAGALVSHTAGVEIETGARGGVFGSLKRMLGGESFFVNTFVSRDREAEVALAPPLPGDIVQRDLTGETVYVTSGSYLAAGEGVEVDTKFGGSRTFLGGEGLFLLRVSGHGPLFLASYGAIEAVEVREGEPFTVDTGHVVAFEDVAFDVRRVGGLKSTLFSGEGLVCEFTGSGTVWVQTRSLDALAAWVRSQVPSGMTATNPGAGGRRDIEFGGGTSRESGGFSVKF